MNWMRVLRETARSGLSIERTRLEPLAALRGAAGVALVIGLALWLVSPAFAASSAFGALAAGTASFLRSWRPRAAMALVAGGVLAVSTFLGYLAAAHYALFVLLLAAWAFLAGLAWAVGNTSGVVASLTVGIMLVTVTIPTSVLGALAHAGVIAFGGLVQAVLIVLFPIRRWGRQRDALADAFAAVADYARRLREDPVAPFDSQPLMTARSAAAVTPRQALRRPAELHGSRALAERIRPVLASLADPTVGAGAEGPERSRARDLLAAAACVLDAAARSVRYGQRARVPVEAVETLRARHPAVLTGAGRRAATRLVALLGEALETADTGGSPTAAVSFASGDRDRASTAPLLRPTMPGAVPDAVRAVRGELRRDSAILRHAVRLSGVASLGYLLGSALPLGHSYWAPMSSVMVMRPDFHRTYARVVARLTGTLVGVGVATGVVQLARPGAYVSGALAVVFVALMYLLLRTGYVVSQACVAAYVVFLLGMGGSAWQQTALDRVLLTLLGGALAMVAYVAFPSWETPRLLDRLADWLAANGRYAGAVIGSYAEGGAEPAGHGGPGGTGGTGTAGGTGGADRAGSAGGTGGTGDAARTGISGGTGSPGDAGSPGGAGRPSGSYASAGAYRGDASTGAAGVRQALLASRASQAAWEEALSRAKLEPVRHPGLTRTTADDAHEAVEEVGRAAMLLEAHIPLRDPHPVPAAAHFASALRTATERAAEDVREGRAPHWDEVEAALDAWEARPDGQDRLVRRGAEVLLESLEDLTATVGTFPLAADGSDRPAA